MTKHEREVRRLLAELAIQHGVEIDYGRQCKKHVGYIIRKGTAERHCTFTKNKSDGAGQFGGIKREFRRVVEGM